MTSSRPYLIRALYDWIADNEMTPHLLVNAEHPLASVPAQFVENGKIVLNVSPFAVEGFSIDNDMIAFSARFSGVATEIFIPVQAVQAIYARENGRGMVFSDGDEDETPPPEAPDTGKRPALRVVK